MKRGRSRRSASLHEEQGPHADDGERHRPGRGGGHHEERSSRTSDRRSDHKPFAAAAEPLAGLAVGAGSGVGAHGTLSKWSAKTVYVPGVFDFFTYALPLNLKLRRKLRLDVVVF